MALLHGARRDSGLAIRWTYQSATTLLGIPSSAIVLRMRQPSRCPANDRARMCGPTVALYRWLTFSTRLRRLWPEVLCRRPRRVNVRSVRLRSVIVVDGRRVPVKQKLALLVSYLSVFGFFVI